MKWNCKIKFYKNKDISLEQEIKSNTTNQKITYGYGQFYKQTNKKREAFEMDIYKKC